MGNTNQIICGKYVGEKLPGQSRLMRNANMADDAELVKDFKGKANLKDILEANAKANPDKLFLGTRSKIIKEDNKVEFGDYEWKTYGQTAKEA